MKYTFTCPADGQVLSTTAENDDEAMNKLLELGKKHLDEYHKGQLPMTEEEAKNLIRALWKKEP